MTERKDVPTGSRLLAFAPDGKTLATAGIDGGAMLWDVPGPNAEGRLVAKEVPADTVASSGTMCPVTIPAGPGRRS